MTPVILRNYSSYLRSYLCINEHETLCFPSVCSRPQMTLFWTEFLTSTFTLQEKLLQKPHRKAWKKFVQGRDMHSWLQSLSIRYLDASCLASLWRSPKRIIRKQCRWWWGREVPSRGCSSISKYTSELLNSKTVFYHSFHALWHIKTLITSTNAEFHSLWIFLFLSSYVLKIATVPTCAGAK